MKTALAALACVILSTFASPLKQRSQSTLERRQIFTDPTCELSQAVTPGTPFSGLFPIANIIGTIVGPIVEETIGAENRERLDTLAGTLCMLVFKQKSFTLSGLLISSIAIPKKKLPASVVSVRSSCKPFVI